MVRKLSDSSLSSTSYMLSDNLPIYQVNDQNGVHSVLSVSFFRESCGFCFGLRHKSESYKNPHDILHHGGFFNQYFVLDCR